MSPFEKFNEFVSSSPNVVWAFNTSLGSLKLHFVLFEQHFYKQHQDKISKKSIKC